MKKIVSGFLAIALMLSLAAPAFAATSESDALEKAILKAKSVITVPANLTEFEYSSGDDPTFGKVWNLNWSDKQYENSCSVSLDENGNIINYYAYTNKDNSGLGGVSREQGQKNAETFLSKVLPTGFKEIKLQDSSSYYNTLSYNYVLYKNDVEVKYATLSLDVDKYSGQVTNYSGYNLVMNSKDTFPDVGTPIGADKARAAYLEKLGTQLTYQLYYDWQKKETKIFAAYTPFDGNKYIDAKTGNVVDGFNSNNIWATRDGGGMGSAASNVKAEQDALTPVERTEIETIKGMMSQNDAIKAAASKVPGLSSSAKPSSANLSRDYMENDKYVWDLYFDDFSVRVNAKTGELISFYNYSKMTNKTTGLSLEKAEKIAQDYMKNAAKDKVDQVAFSESLSNVGGPAVPYKGNDSAQYNFVYTRQVNGISFPGNTINIVINKEDGAIVQYSMTWNDNASFPAVDGVISKEKAFDIFAESGNYALTYVKVDEKKAGLVYDFDKQPEYMLDPFTGAKIGSDGKPYRADAPVQGYDDIDGTWYANTVLRLLDNGYYLTGTSFNGNAQITQEEFLRYLYSPSQSYYEQDAFYKMLISDKVIKEGEKAPDQLLARQDAVKFAIRTLGLEKAAQNGSIYKSVFNDSVSDAYTGYAALAKSLQIANGDKSGKFNGANILTRAEAAVIIYNTLQNK